MQKYKIVIAAGGTGGHLFPAQGLAEQLLKKNPDLKLMFVGAKLTDKAHFDKTKFSFRDISSRTPFGGNLIRAFKSIGPLLKGIYESFLLLKDEKPDLVIGFGSFHVFPFLFATAIKKIPLVLFESNSIPGKVTRLFSKKTLTTAIYFEQAKRYLKGNTVEVEIPIRNPEYRQRMQSKDAQLWLGLDVNLPTLLVFGGSQGARQINQYILELLPLLKKKNPSFQLIHLTGNEETAKEVNLLCQSLSIPCYARKFETRMDIVWNAADIAICRSGAMTLSELLHYEVPAILIPYPFASDEHQLKNAQVLQQKVGGAIHFSEHSVTAELLAETVYRLISLNSDERLKMKRAIMEFKVKQKKEDLSSLIIEILEKGSCKK